MAKKRIQNRCNNCRFNRQYEEENQVDENGHEINPSFHCSLTMDNPEQYQDIRDWIHSSEFNVYGMPIGKTSDCPRYESND